ASDPPGSVPGRAVPRTRPRGLLGPVRPPADARAQGGGRPARGRAGRRRARLPRLPRGARRARPRGGDRVPRAHRGAARAQVAAAKVSVGERRAVLRALLRRGRVSCDEAVRGADRVTVAVTLFALLELYKQGEATWEQGEPFGDITIAPRAASASEAAA